MANTPVVVLDDTLTDIADAIRAKTGGSATMTPSEMPTEIANIPSGGGTGIPREVSATGVYQIPPQNFTFSLPATAVDIGEYALQYAFYNCTPLISADLGHLTTVSGGYALSNAFYGCTNLASINFGSLVNISSDRAFYRAFLGCSSITSAAFPLLDTISGNNAFNYAFSGCTNLTSINLSALSTVSGSSAMANAFESCTNLTSINFASLSEIAGGSALSNTFKGCTSLASISFPALTSSSFPGSVTNQLTNMVSGVTGCTIHFPAAVQAKIETMTGYPNFGGTNTTVLFDL